MKLNDIKTFKNRTALKIREGRLSEALADMRAMSESGMTWEISSEIDRIEENYRYMLGYVAAGADDPGRQAVYDSLVTEALSVVDRLARKANIPENPSLYYSTLRTLSTRGSESIASLTAAYRAELQRLDMDFESIADPARSRAAEDLLNSLFDRIWVTHPLSAADAAAIATFTAPDSAMPLHARGLVISAVTLGQLEFYDSRRLALLIGAYTGTDPDTDARALAGVAASMYRYRYRPVPRDIANRLAAMKEIPGWQRHFAFTAIEFMRTADTRRLTEKMQNEVIPSLLKIDPDLQAKLQNGEFDAESLAEGMNPEWEEALAGSEIGRTLKELGDIQAEGGDIMMSSFRHMKHFPFFHRLSNWFLPFYDANSAVASVDDFEGSLGNLLRMVPVLCDSDKYSLVLAAATMPVSQREAALGAMKMQAEQARQAMSEVEKASGDGLMRNAINKYVQNLYRFYEIHRRRGEFFPLFGEAPDMLQVRPLASGFDNEELLATVAGFYFRHKFWREAASAFRMLDGISMPDAARSQQWGYALECAGDIPAAISRYEEAEMLDGGSQWTLRRLAAALRREGKPERAAGYYTRLAEMLPDDPAVALSLGYALIEAGKPDRAKAQFYKAAYLTPDSMKPLRALAWTQFLTHEFDRAKESYDKIIVLGASPDDYLNAGHVARALGDLREAINYYRLYASTDTADPDRLEKALRADDPHLSEAGIDTSSMMLIVEAVKYAN